MIDTSDTIFQLYATAQDALEDLCDTLIVEEAYFNLFGDEQLAFHDWVFERAHDYIDEDRVDWISAFHDWREE